MSWNWSWHLKLKPYSKTNVLTVLCKFIKKHFRVKEEREERMRKVMDKIVLNIINTRVVLLGLRSSPFIKWVVDPIIKRVLSSLIIFKIFCVFISSMEEMENSLIGEDPNSSYCLGFKTRNYWWILCWKIIFNFIVSMYNFQSKVFILNF